MAKVRRLAATAKSSIASEPRRPSAGVVLEDCLTFMKRLPEGCCDLIYVDPPFGPDVSAYGAARPLNRGSAAVEDGVKDFIEFLRPRFCEMHRLLARSGSLYVHLDWRFVHYVKVMLDEIFGAKQFLNEIIWSYRSGSRPGRWFARKHDSILLYAKQAGEHTFHCLRGGAYRTQDMKVDDQGRPFKSTRNGPIFFHPNGPALTDVWEIPFLSTVSKERNGYPSQKPEALLERIIQASSNEGDCVADFFCGSGTTLAVAKRLGRRWLGCDINPQAVEVAKSRLR